VPAGEDGGIYDMQERMNVALPSDEDEEDGANAGRADAVERGYGAPTGAPPGQTLKLPPPRPVWNRTEEGRREMESLGKILAERVIGQEAAVDMVATTMQMCYVPLPLNRILEHSSDLHLKFCAVLTADQGCCRAGRPAA
jgi:hypothetical protein